MAVPANPKIYHITHLRNLAAIAEAGCIWSDAKRIELGLDCEVVGMSEIKRRRLQEIRVKCHPQTKVGEYVPFYFCPRSIMLYILHMGHSDLTYTQGQGPIVHLQADLHAAIAWAEAHNVTWAFSDRNAGTYIAEFYNDVQDLEHINWAAVSATDFRDSSVKEGKQAEFLMYDSFPWELIEKIGVISGPMAGKAIAQMGHQPPVQIERMWYY